MPDGDANRRTGRFDDSTLSALAQAAFRQAAVNVIRRAKETGTPVILWDQGRVVSVSPYDLPEIKPDTTS
jgi:hypothetical protein